MTTTTGITSTTATTGSSTTSATATQQYSSEMFLKLLTTQLANQDPSSPMDSTQMISQTSQLASMEQLTTLNSTLTSSYALQQRETAANVLGKTVAYTDSSGAAKSGTVTAVSFSGTTPTLTVGSDSVALSSLTSLSST